MRKRIAVDASPLARAQPTGTAVYARELTRRLPPAAPDFEWTFYSPAASPDAAVDLTVMPFPFLRTQVRLPLELARGRPDLLFTPAHQLPAVCPVPALTVIHGLEYLHFQAGYSTRERLALDAALWLAKRHSPLIVSVSEATRRDLVERRGIQPERVRVVHPGPGHIAEKVTATAARGLVERLGIEGDYVLAVGRVEKRKNQLTVLRALETLPPLRLVVVGPVFDLELARELDKSERCLRLDWVDGATRDALYMCSRALVFPSLYEGFGLPILEAMKLGAPVVTARNSSLPEVGGDAALYVDDPLDIDELAHAVTRVTEDASLRQDLIARGHRNVERFSWDRCAAGIVEVIREALQA